MLSNALSKQLHGKGFISLTIFWPTFLLHSQHKNCRTPPTEMMRRLKDETKSPRGFAENKYGINHACVRASERASSVFGVPLSQPAGPCTPSRSVRIRSLCRGESPPSGNIKFVCSVRPSWPTYGGYSDQNTFESLIVGAPGF